MVSTIDMIIIAIYFIGLIFMGYVVGKGNNTQEDYFIAGRSMPWIPVALSVAATTISGNGYIGGPGWAYGTGMMAFMLQFSIPLVMCLVLTIFLPFLYNLNVTSCYEYIEKRLGVRSRTLSACGFLATCTFQVSSMVYIPALIIQKFTGWDMIVIVSLITLVTIIYTILGGIKADIISDAIQMIIMWVGLAAAIPIILGSMDVGFFDAIGVLREAGKLKALDFSLDMSLENGFWVALFGGTIMWLQFFATDQSQTQRTFAAKSIKEVKLSLVLSAIMMNLMYFVFMIIGLLLFVYYKGQEFPTPNDVMIDFISTKMPIGLFGLMIAALFSAAMSSISSMLNAMGTVFVKDIYERFVLKDQEKASLKVSMSFTGIFAVIVVIVTMMAFNGTTLSILATVGSYISYVTGSIMAVYILAMFTNTANDLGTSIGFITGVVVTTMIGKTTSINWLWYNMIGVIISIIVGYICSVIFKHNEEEIEGINGGEVLVKPGAKENANEYTIVGLRNRLIKENKTMENGESILPGTFDKYSYILLGFFIFQFVVLILLGR